VSWILKWVGKDLFFRDITGLGPRCTDNLKLAEKFSSKEDAERSEAYWAYPLATFEAVEERQCKKNQQRSRSSSS
jgi:hypothetical protein